MRDACRKKRNPDDRTLSELKMNAIPFWGKMLTLLPARIRSEKNAGSPINELKIHAGLPYAATMSGYWL
jgi:hypothetical protein